MHVIRLPPIIALPPLSALLTLLSLSVGCSTATQARRDEQRHRRTHLSEQINEPSRPRTAPRERSTHHRRASEHALPRSLPDTWRNGAPVNKTLLSLLDEADKTASPMGRRVLRTGRRLIIEDPTVIRGSCWTWTSGVYKRAGIERKQRQRIYKTGKQGPWAGTGTFKPGDWLSFINHSYHDGEHSAIFVTWVNRSRKEALMMSYVGGRRRVPGDYRTYLLSSVYMIQRARPQRPPRSSARRGGEAIWDGGEGDSAIKP